MSDRKTQEGYSDPTAYQAMMNLLKIEELRFCQEVAQVYQGCV